MTDTAAKPKPKPPGRKAEQLTPAEQLKRFHDLCDELGTDRGETLDKAFGKIVPPKPRGVKA